jgi:hypothetical protein
LVGEEKDDEGLYALTNVRLFRRIGLKEEVPIPFDASLSAFKFHFFDRKDGELAEKTP